MRNFTIPEAADGLDRERVPSFAGRKRSAALASINAFAAALLLAAAVLGLRPANAQVAPGFIPLQVTVDPGTASCEARLRQCFSCGPPPPDRKSTRLNSSHRTISYAVFCLKKKNHTPI